MSLLTPIAFFDPPIILNPTITPIPASSSAPLQVIADTGINVGVGVAYIDNTGDFIGVYVGAVNAEVLTCIIGNGVSGVSWGKFPPNSRVSLRSMTNQAITGGLLSAAVVTG